VLDQPDGSGFAFAAPGRYTGCGGSGCTGAVKVNVGDAVVRATGPEAYAVYVQSRGNGVNDTTVNVTAGGRVQNWEQSAAAVYVDGARTNTITVDDGGTIEGTGAAGVAITGARPAAIRNAGTIIGSVHLPTESSTLDNRPGGRLIAGETVDLGADGALVNGGAVDVGGTGRVATTTLAGDFVQGPSGTLLVDADHARAVADRLEVTGSASLEGVVAVNPLSLTSSPATLLRADGPLAVDPAAVSFTRTHLFSYSPTTDGHSLQLQPHAHFQASEPGLDGTQREVAAHLQGVWDSGDPRFGGGFAALTEHRQGGSPPGIAR